MKKHMKILIAATGAGVLAVAAFADDHRPGDRMVEKFDLNGDSAISLAEIESHKSQMFSDADIDGSGGITFDEFNAFAEAEKARREAERRQRRFERLDANGDGTISADEHANVKPGRLERMFDLVDENNDGIITLEEREAAREAMGERRGKRRPRWRRGE